MSRGPYPQADLCVAIMNTTLVVGGDKCRVGTTVSDC